MTIIIENEDDLFALLEDIEGGHEVEPGEVQFNGWPKYRVIIRGEDFDGGIPTRIMPALLDLQRAVDQAYARSVYGQEKRLSKDERRKTEFVVQVRQGSSIFEADIWKTLNTLLETAARNMTGTQSLVAILGVAGILGVGWYIKMWLAAQSRDKRTDFDAMATQEETERYRMIAELAKDNVHLRANKEAIDDGNSSLVRKLEEADVLVADQDKEIGVTGEEARKIVRKSPVDPVQVRLDGNYIILAVQSGSVKSGFRASIENIETGEQLSIDIPDGTLSEEQIKSLQEGEWGKATLDLQINARKRGDRVLSATLTHAGLRRSET